MIFLPESPRWLAQAGFRDRALTGFRRLGRGEEAAVELEDVERLLTEEQEGFGLLLQPGFRVAVFVGIGLAVFQQITGINTIIYYSPEILRMSGYPSAKAAIFAAGIIGVVNVLITVVSVLLVDRLGRRFLLLFGTAGMAVALIVVGLAFQRHTTGSAVSCAMIAYVIFFGIGLGPVVWLLISEIYPIRIRGKAMSLAVLTVWGANWLVASTFLSLIHGVGPAITFWIFAALCVLAFAFCSFFVPETKGKSLEDLERHWMRSAAKPPE
jgi:sugar porter (SP) family MFS transporter